MGMQHIFDLLLNYRYVVLVPFSIIEGPTVSVISGVFIKLGYFNLILAYVVLVVGDIISDVGHYYIGHWGNRLIIQKYVSQLGLIGKNLTAITHLWKTHPAKMMFLSKLAYGISGTLVVSSSLAHMSLKRFLRYTIPISLFQHVLFLAVGYGLGYSYELASGYIAYAGIGIAVIAVLFVLTYIGIAKRARHMLEEMQ